MSTTPNTPNQPDELAVLRQTVVELTQKNAQRKARIAELEQQLQAANTATQTAQASLHEIIVSRPLQTLAEAISPTPELFLTELERVGYKVTASNGRLTLMQGDKPVECDVTADGITKLLLTDDPAHKNFPHLLTKSKASGGGATGHYPNQGITPSTSTHETKPKFSGLGLR